MKKGLLGVLLAGMLLAAAGCGGGGSSSSTSSEVDGSAVSIASTATVSLSTTDAQDTSIGYTVTNSSGDTITMIIYKIAIASRKVTIYCKWTATNSSGAATITKLSDSGKTTFYMVDSKGTKYYHSSGTGAAYTTTDLSSTAVTGTYTFSTALASGITSVYFYDSDYAAKTGLVTITD